MPQMFIDVTGRRPTRFPRLYARLERSCIALHEQFYAGGATEEDRAMSFPCDSYMDPPLVSGYRAIDVLAPKEIVYRWLCQLRVAPYAYDWLDHFGRQSARRLTPGVERLSVGQPIFTMFEVIEFAENEHITLRSALFKWFSGQELTMTYRVVPLSATSCRIVTKATTHHGQFRFSSLVRREFYPIGEVVLMRKQLSTLKRLAEQQFLEELAGGRRVADDPAAQWVSS